eukprot:gene68-12888_t
MWLISAPSRASSRGHGFSPCTILLLTSCFVADALSRLDAQDYGVGSGSRHLLDRASERYTIANEQTGIPRRTLVHYSQSTRAGSSYPDGQMDEKPYQPFRMALDKSDGALLVNEAGYGGSAVEWRTLPAEEPTFIVKYTNEITRARRGLQEDDSLTSPLPTPVPSPPITPHTVTLEVNDYIGLLRAIEATQAIWAVGDNHSAVLIKVMASTIPWTAKDVAEAPTFNWSSASDGNPANRHLNILGQGSTIDCGLAAHSVFRFMSAGHIHISGITFTQCLGPPLDFASPFISPGNARGAVVLVSDCTFTSNVVSDIPGRTISAGIAAGNLVQAITISSCRFEGNKCAQPTDNGRDASLLFPAASAVVLHNVSSVNISGDISVRADLAWDSSNL